MIGVEKEESMEISVMPSSHLVIIKKPLSIIKKLLKIAIEIGDRAVEGIAYRDIGT